MHFILLLVYCLINVAYGDTLQSQLLENDEESLTNFTSKHSGLKFTPEHESLLHNYERILMEINSVFNGNASDISNLTSVNPTNREILHFKKKTEYAWPADQTISHPPFETTTKINPVKIGDPISFTEINCPLLAVQHKKILESLEKILINEGYSTATQNSNDSQEESDSEIFIRDFFIESKSFQRITYSRANQKILVDLRSMRKISLRDFINFLFAQKRILKTLLPFETDMKNVYALSYPSIVRKLGQEHYNRVKNIRKNANTASNTVTH